MMISVSGLKLTVKMLDVCLCLFNLDKKIESSNKGRRLAPSSPTVVVELAMQQSLLVSWVFLPLLVVVMPRIRSRKATSLCLGTLPLAVTVNHQDDIPFLVGNPEKNLHLWLLLGGVSFLGNFQSLLCWYPSSTYKSTLALCISKFLFCPGHDLFDDVFNVTSMDKRMAFPRSQHLTFLVPCLPGFFHVSWQGDKVTVSCAEGDTGFIYKGELKFESLGPKKLQSWWNKKFKFSRIFNGDLPSLKRTARTWKLVVGRWISFWNGLFSGAILVSGRVHHCCLHLPYQHHFLPKSELHFIYFDRKTPKIAEVKAYYIFYSPIHGGVQQMVQNLLERNINIKKKD